MYKLVDPSQSISDSFDLSALPDSFRDLKPFILRWAESDDAERTALLEESTQEPLRELIEAVSPHFEQINEYLDSFGDRPAPEAATALGALAEAAAEARLKLQRES